MVFSVRTFNNINQVGLKELGNKFQIDGDHANNPDAFIIRSENLHGFDFPENLKAIARAGAGTNNIPIEEATEKGIVVFNTPGANANAVKEAVIASILLSARDYIGATAWANTLSGDDVPKQVEAGKKQFAGTEISGKTLGVIGLGAIGARIANDARRLGMNVLGYDPYVSVETAWTISSHVKRVDDLKEIFTNADYITVHVPLTDKTRGLFNSDSFGQMKKGTTLINFARGELVVTSDLFEAIEAGVIKKYITDFGNEEVLNRENIGEIINSVNFPNMKQFLDAPYRITLINKNVPNIVASITTAVSELEINIDNIINRSKGNYAYTLLDLDESDETKIAKLVEKFKATDAITKVRVIKHK